MRSGGRCCLFLFGSVRWMLLILVVVLSSLLLCCYGVCWCV